MRDDQKTKTELGSGAGGKKPIKEAEKLRARKAKLERVSSELTKHKNADEDLDKARADCEKTFDAISDWIVLIDLKGRILRTNRSGEDFTGISSAQIVGQSCCKLVHGSEEHIPSCPLQKMLHSRQRERAELKVPDTNRWLLVTVDPVTDKEGNLIGAVHITRDVTERKRAEEALRQSEEKFRSIFDNANDIIASVTKTGKILKVNKKIEDILGYKPDELIGKNFMTLGILAAKNAAKMFHIFKEAVKIGGFLVSRDGRNVTEVWVNHKDGHTVLLEANTTTIKEDGKLVGYLSVIRDITERKRAEEALRESQENYRMVSRLTSDYIVKTKVEPNGQMVFVSATDRLVNMTGYAVDELRSQSSWSKIVHPDDFDKFQDFWKRIVSSRKPCELEFRGIDRKQQFEWLHAYGQPILDEKNDRVISIVFAAKDITERKLAEEAYRSLVDHSLQGLAIFQNGRVVFANQAMAEITGYTVEEMLTLPSEQVWAFVYPDDRELVWSRHRGRLNGEELPERYEFRGIRKDGSMCWVEIHASRIEFQGKPAIQAAYVDITERKKAEEASNKSKDLLEKTFSSLDSSVFVLDDQKPPVILDCNPSAATIFGYSKKEILGRTTEFLHVSRSTIREFQEVLYPAIEERGQISFFEFKMKRKNGDVFPSEHSVIPLKDHAGKRIGWISVVRDISERKKAEEALRESEEKFKGIFEHANDGVIYLDSSGNILDINEKAVQMFGGPKQQAVNKHFTEVGVFPADEIPTFMSNFEKIFAGEEVVLTVPIKNIKGQELILECSASIAKTDDGAGRIMVIARDITERIKASEQIEKLAKFPTENPNPVLRISGRGTVIYANKASANLLKTWDCRVGKSVTDRWNELVMDSLSSGQSQQTEVKCDGRIFSLTFAPVAKANYVNVYGHDITERKKAEEEIQNLNKYREQMAQAEQLASVGTLSASLAHELTQPLTVVRLSIENSLAELEKTSCPDTVVEDLKEGLSGVSSIASIVNRFRNFARRSSEIKVAEVDLKTIAERIVELLDESAWRAKVTLQVKGMDKLPPIYSHEKDLERLFFSLIENAIQAADGKKSRQVIISDAVIDEHIELQFSDNCGGIAPENLDKIFEPFFTTKPAGERTGLGLCVVERIVSQLGGKVRVESKLGKGSTFFVTLPIKRDER